MPNNRIPTTFRKIFFFILLLSSLLFLSGCGDFSPIDENSTGFFNRTIVYPLSLFIKILAQVFNGSYGLSIIVITLVIRLIIMPFMIKQQKQSQEMQEKMAMMKPEIDAIQEKYKGKQKMDDQLAMQRELSELYKEHDFKPGQMVTGCLPILLQMPVLIGFFYAIRRTPEISEASFLWFNLGETDFFLVLLAAFVYFLQARFSLMGVETRQGQPNMMAMMAYISPIMIGFISLTMPAALPLYWVVSGLFMTIQTFLIKKYMPKRTPVN